MSEKSRSRRTGYLRRSSLERDLDRLLGGEREGSRQISGLEVGGENVEQNLVGEVRDGHGEGGGREEKMKAEGGKEANEFRATESQASRVEESCYISCGRGKKKQRRERKKTV